MKIETTISARHFYIVIGIVYFIKKYLLECSTFLINKSLQPTCPLRGSSHLRIACNKISRLRLMKRKSFCSPSRKHHVHRGRCHVLIHRHEDVVVGIHIVVIIVVLLGKHQSPTTISFFYPQVKFRREKRRFNC